MATSNLKDRAVLVKFSDRVWMGGMVDRAVGDDVASRNGAKSNVGHYWKRLIPKAAIRPRANAGNAARAFHLANTLPWMEGGVRILPIANYNEYTKGMRKLMSEAAKEERKLISEYPSWIKEAQRTHGKLFNKAHFPEPEALREKFGIEVDVIPLPNVSDWRVDLSQEQANELKAAAEAKFAAVQREGVLDLFGRLSEILDHVKTKLSDPEGVFRDSMVANIKEMLPLISRLNVTGDKQLEEIRKEVEAKLSTVGPEELRTNPERRAQAAKDASAIMKKMSSYMKKAK